MYGMVNKFISTSVVDRYGQEKWNVIESQLGSDNSQFIEMQPYPDDVTFGIVGKSIEVLGVDPAEFLRELGQDWVRYTSKGSYKDMYSLTGGGLFEFIENLNNMHQAIGAQLPGLKPPSFICQKDGDKRLVVQYYSDREGLDIFVVGLLEGLCEHFGEHATVEVLSGRSEQQAFTVFEIAIS